MTPVIPSKKFLTLFDPNAPGTTPAPVPPPAAVFTQEQLQGLVAQARKEEKDKLYKDLEKKKAELKEAQDKIELQEKAAKELALKTMPVDEKLQAQLANVEKTLLEERAARIAAETRASQEGLERYRSEAIARAQAAGVKLLPEYVIGSNPQEIDQAILISKAEYTRVQTEMIADLAKQGYQVTPVTAAPPATNTQPVIPSPHFVPPYVAGLPSVVNPSAAPPQQQLSMEDLTQLTSEENVRNGTYAKYRAGLMGGLRSQVPAGQGLTFGNNPRFTGPQVPQQQYQTIAPSQPQFAPAPPQNQFQPSVLPSPVGQPGSQQVPLNDMSPDQLTAFAAQLRAQGGRSGPNAQAALVTRFSPTPPVK